MDYFSQAISLSLLQGTKENYNTRSKLIRGNTKSVLEMTLRDFKPFYFFVSSLQSISGKHFPPPKENVHITLSLVFNLPLVLTERRST